MPQFPAHLVAPLYQEPHRFYHNIEHIHSLIRLLDELYDTAVIVGRAEYEALLAVIWLHDAYYDPKARQGMNEEHSANIGWAIIGELWSDERIRVDGQVQYVKNWIMNTIRATAFHTVDQPHLDTLQRLFMDMDLAGLGSDPQEYRANSLAIRKEYAHVSDDEFAAGRIKFCQAMLARKTIYYNVLYFKLEKQARENLQNEIDRLSIF